MEAAAQPTVTENPSWANKDTLRCGSSFFVLQAYDFDHNSKVYSESRKKSKWYANILKPIWNVVLWYTVYIHF